MTGLAESRVIIFAGIFIAFLIINFIGYLASRLEKRGKDLSREHDLHDKKLSMAHDKRMREVRSLAMEQERRIENVRRRKHSNEDYLRNLKLRIADQETAKLRTQNQSADTSKDQTQTTQNQK